MQRLYSYLPPSLLKAASSLPERIKAEATEFRIRLGGALSLSTYEKNLFLTGDGRVTKSLSESYVCTENDIAFTLSRLTQNSVYRYMSTITSGYIVTPEGIRVGVSGEAVYDKGRVSALARFFSLNIRLHREIENSADILLEYLNSHCGASLLIYSPPGFGKTTVIRSLSKGLATGRLCTPSRVCVIDERGEILPSGGKGMIDRFGGYSKPDGIEIAVRLFSPEYIVCDEIGLADDTEAILSVQNTGVAFIATTHGRTADEVLMRPNIKRLADSGVFDSFVRLERHDGHCICRIEEYKV